MATHRDHSKTNWKAQGSTLEEINTGSLQRIADATEAMAKNYVQMQRDLDWYKSEYARDREKIKHLENSRAAHKANATRLRNKLAEVNQ